MIYNIGAGYLEEQNSNASVFKVYSSLKLNDKWERKKNINIISTALLPVAWFSRIIKLTKIPVY